VLHGLCRHLIHVVRDTVTQYSHCMGQPTLAGNPAWKLEDYVGTKLYCLHTCPCWSLVCSDLGENARFLFSGVTCAVSIPFLCDTIMEIGCIRTVLQVSYIATGINRPRSHHFHWIVVSSVNVGECVCTMHIAFVVKTRAISKTRLIPIYLPVYIKACADCKASDCA